MPQRRGGVGCGPYFPPGPPAPFPPWSPSVADAEFGFKEGDFPVTEFAGRTSIATPFHNHLTAEEIDPVAGVLERALGEV